MATDRRYRLDANTALTRVGQVVSTLTHRHNEEIDQRIQILLNDESQWRLVARLSSFDRAHHLNVYDLLVRWEFSDPDLLRAALLHDIGKSDGTHQVRLWHRIGRVIGRRAAPTTWKRLSQRPARFRAGLYLAEHHARFGAGAARVSGASARCCELILRHEESIPTGDVLLDALIEADGAVAR